MLKRLSGVTNSDFIWLDSVLVYICLLYPRRSAVNNEDADIVLLTAFRMEAA